MKKPELPSDTTSKKFSENVRMILQTITGRRNNKITLPSAISADAVGVPTKAEFDALRADVLDVRATLAALLSRLDE